MTNDKQEKKEITLYLKFGVVGVAESVDESTTLVIDPNLPDELNAAIVDLQMKAFQSKVTRASLQMLVHVAKLIDPDIDPNDLEALRNILG